MANKNLTIIVPIYRPSISLDDIFYNITKQKDQNFNVIVVIDHPNEEAFDSITKFQEKFGSETKIIINSAHQHIDLVLKQAAEYVQTDYIYVLYSYSKLKSEFTKHINEYLNKIALKPDVIEISSSLRGLVNFDFRKQKVEENMVIDLDKNFDPLALATPFSFDCIIKSSIFSKVYETLKNKDMNLQYSPILVYKSLIHASTFTYLKTTWIEDWNYEIMLLNPKSISRGWNTILASATNLSEEKQQALRFAEFMDLAFYFAGYVGACKFKKNTQEARSIKNIKIALEAEIKKRMPTWIEETETNPYFVRFNAKSLIKIIENVSDWESILKKFLW
ncbi:glycosyltransferase family 2 protein [Metamycoplasma neophronis]|uniref:Glycosyltransferase family 2 protein n=1 Tax=Metamycoplasma neophronis TaxID=872983 RepID=A0ABY2Z086_9BACT|nr:glycosyltransferase family 2 protein [Metamycoplasma neophronis]TPR53856.1 glycosyltransferase family 2 protein [Metamycoplasma neophronis]